ncbi:hypothetical protein Bbelb_142490 [Branchiostoma belcheri]|nr:hypothetical protein Bbelb_142490 [Branchiostoma belcheri]
MGGSCAGLSHAGVAGTRGGALTGIIRTGPRADKTVGAALSAARHPHVPSRGVTPTCYPPVPRSQPQSRVFRTLEDKLLFRAARSLPFARYGGVEPGGSLAGPTRAEYSPRAQFYRRGNLGLRVKGFWLPMETVSGP